MFNVVFLVRKRENMSQEEFTRYWINEHTPITAAVPGVRAYKCFPLTGFDGQQPPYDAIAYLSFDDEAAWRKAEKSQEMQAALADASNFQNTDETTAFYASDHTIV